MLGHGKVNDLMSPFPISVVIPIYQCAERLPEHVECLSRLRNEVHEFIWVITESFDGSHQLAREAAKELGGKVLELPRGLYQAWNAGIVATTGEFIYISTVGDTIQTEGLATLRRTLEETGGDMIFSPPVIHPPSRKNIKETRHWPLFRFASVLAPFAGRKIPLKMAVLMQILAGASGLTGSAASCLFRASFLKSRPFPTDHHHYGDTAWFYQNLAQMNLVYFPQGVARFFIHDPEIRRTVDKRQIYSLMGHLGSFLPLKEKDLVLKLIRACNRVDSFRDSPHRIPWWILPEAWLSRSEKRQIEAQLIDDLSDLSSSG
jgi:glycosyltransferase involved in cell wall biosynthesis